MISLILFFHVIIYSEGNEIKAGKDFFITVDLSHDNPYQGEGLIMTLMLHSITPDIVNAEIISVPSVSNGDFSIFKEINSSETMKHEQIGNKHYYSVPIKRYLISFPDSRTYTLKGAECDLYVKIQHEYNDFFGIRRRGYQVQKINIEIPDRKVKVQKLPAHLEYNSGAMGKFKLNATLPKGDIIMNETATVIFELKGAGILCDNVLPDYASAFNKDVKLRSMSESRNMYYDGADVISVLTMECEFIPISKDAKIDPLSFTYFNPDTGKYETAVSENIKLDVKSVISKIDTIEI